jgi:predicted DNA binding CopG/RHH family protein
MSNDNILDMPKFTTEREEAEWWDNNPDFLLKQLQQAREEGRLGHGTAVRKALEKQAAKSTTIRLDEGDLSLAKKQAGNKGLRYQTYLKMLIHEALVREEKHSA